MNYSDHVGTRITKQMRTAFVKKAKACDSGPSEVMRDLIIAFVEDRLTITPPAPTLKGIYKS